MAATVNTPQQLPGGIPVAPQIEASPLGNTPTLQSKVSDSSDRGERSPWPRECLLKTATTSEYLPNSQTLIAFVLLELLRTFTGCSTVILNEKSIKQSNLQLTLCFGCSVFEAELADHIPVVKTSVAGTRLVGRVTVGMPTCMLCLQ